MSILSSKSSTMLIAPELAPLGISNLGAAVRDWAEALDKQKWQVHVVFPIDSEVDTSPLGMARRLAPVEVKGGSYVVHEGTMAGGVSVLAVAAQSGDTRPDAAQCLAVALSLHSVAPDLLQFWANSGRPEPLQQALNLCEELQPSPRVVVHKDSALDAPTQYRALQLSYVRLTPGCDSRIWKLRREAPTSAKKALAKTALRTSMKLRERDCPMIAVLGKIPRLSRSASDELLALPAQFVGVGAGQHWDSMATRAPTQVASPRRLSTSGAQALRKSAVAAADFVLLPPLFEPVSQLYATRLGTAVIAPNEGEFAERLVDFDSSSKTGSGFLYNNEGEIVSAVRRAISAWERGEEIRDALIERCLALDLSWETVALRFNETFWE